MWLFYYYLWLATLCVRCLVYIDCVDVTIKRPCCWLVFSVRTFINWIGLCTNPYHYYCLFLSPFYNHANGRSGLIWNPIVWFLLILHSAASSWWSPGPIFAGLSSQWVWRGRSTEEKARRGAGETAAKWLWHARPSLLSRGRAFRVGCWCKSLCKTFYTKKRIDRSPRTREKRTKSIPLPLPLWASCGWQGRSRLGTICKFRRSARQ
jgi:hypothetical protein